jgi:hypothetical protein
MEIPLHQLQAECDRAVAEFLAIEGWPCQKHKVETAVREIAGGTRSANSCLAWLLNLIPRLPSHVEPARRLHDLTQAVAALQARQHGQMPVGAGRE